MGENFTPWGWGTQNLCAKIGTDGGAGSCVNFRKSLTATLEATVFSVAFISVGGIIEKN